MVAVFLCFLFFFFFFVQKHVESKWTLRFYQNVTDDHFRRENSQKASQCEPCIIKWLPSSMFGWKHGRKPIAISIRGNSLAFSSNSYWFSAKCFTVCALLSVLDLAVVLYHSKPADTIWQNRTLWLWPFSKLNWLFTVHRLLFFF